MKITKIRALIDAGLTDDQIAAIAKMEQPAPAAPAQAAPAPAADPDGLGAIKKQLDELTNMFQTNNIKNQQQPGGTGEPTPDDIMLSLLD